MIEVNDEVVSEGLRLELEIELIPSPGDECLKIRSRYVVLAWTAKLEVVAELLLFVVTVALATELRLQTTVEAMPVPQVLFEALLLESPL